MPFSVRSSYSKISKLHYFKLIFRLGLFFSALTVTVLDRLNRSIREIDEVAKNSAVYVIIWCIFVIEILFRFFPSRLESMGCQKQFAKNYCPTGRPLPKRSGMGTFVSLVSWCALNFVIFLLYRAGVIDREILFLIALAFSVCDMICILFFCPFQTWFLKNKCCGACRIYNWDYAMMFTPMAFTGTLFGLSLFGAGLALLARWEITYRLHPERFYEETNGSLRCANCEEKLCHHKKQLLKLAQKLRAEAEEAKQRISP